MEDLELKELMAVRKIKRIELDLMVKSFNQWNKEHFPGQFLPVFLAVEDWYGFRKITT